MTTRHELTAEIDRLRAQIQYALDGPDHAFRSILFDALNGCDGANLDEIHAKHGTWEQHQEREQVANEKAGKWR